jgi:hypothetical protein
VGAHEVDSLKDENFETCATAYELNILSFSLKFFCMKILVAMLILLILMRDPCCHGE